MICPIFTPVFAFQKRQNLEELIRIIEQAQILGENPLKFWEINNYLAELEIINPEIQIKIAKGDYSPQDKEEFQTQIKELLELKVIRPSNSSIS